MLACQSHKLCNYWPLISYGWNKVRAKTLSYLLLKKKKNDMENIKWQGSMCEVYETNTGCILFIQYSRMIFIGWNLDYSISLGFASWSRTVQILPHDHFLLHCTHMRTIFVKRYITQILFVFFWYFILSFNRIILFPSF